uniref:CX domain-containing protein n=1 Tax=Caenorhabditis tropicalis TaxID=1561998 RepID=A0A1I7UG71_9PELO
MGFFSHAAMLGVGYMIGKTYCFRYKVHQLPNDPEASEISFRVERKEGAYPMFWCHPWWNHHHCHPHYQRNENQGGQNQMINEGVPQNQQKKNSELLD